MNIIKLACHNRLKRIKSIHGQKFETPREEAKKKPIKCLSCSEQVRTWKQENPEYPTYIDSLGRERHHADNVLMCLNKDCVEHGNVHKYLEGIQIVYDIKLDIPQEGN